MIRIFKHKWVRTLLVRVVFVLFGTGYYAHLLYEKAHQQIPIADVISQDYHTITEPFISLLGKAEGKTENFYPDNKGYAVGYGFNPTQNSAEYNQGILDFAGVDKKTSQAIVQNAGKYQNVTSKVVPEELKNVHLSDTQINRMAVYAQKSYENGFIAVFKEKLQDYNYNQAQTSAMVAKYYALPENQKAVLIHMTYKVGGAGLRKYHTFFLDFINYLNHETPENQAKVANDFIYHYTVGKQVLLDTRVMKIHHDIFMAPPVYNKITAKPVKELTEAERYANASQSINEEWSLKSIWAGIKERYARADNQPEDSQTADNTDNTSVTETSDDSDQGDNTEVNTQVIEIIRMTNNGQVTQTIINNQVDNDSDE